MWLKDKVTNAVRAVREYPSLRASLGAAEYERKQTEHALEQKELECEDLREVVEAASHRLRFSECRAAALQSALREFAPKLSGTEEMKRFYETLAPSLDAGGYTLFHTAERLAGVTVSSMFPYEDACGMFQKVDGRELMRYLTACCFDAVEWQPVPGAACDKAVLREVDTASPEYQRFERQLYQSVLERMGFEEFLGLAVQQEQEPQLRAQAPAMTMT